MKTYLLVAAAMLAVVTVPTPASALSCFPPSTDVSDQLDCQTAHLIQCAGGLSQTCAEVNEAVDDAIETVDDAENLAWDTVGDAYRLARTLIHYNLP